MARSIYSDKLKNRSNRLKLPVRKKPFKVLIAPGIFLCYRRNTGPGTWSVETGWLKRFAIADDYKPANGKSVMDFWQAQRAALQMVRGSEGDTDKPVTVAEALDAYKTDLQARGGSAYNARTVRQHLSPTLLSKVVGLLTEVELKTWLVGLTAKGLKPASANRYAKGLMAALNLAAARDHRITNAAAWKNGLKPLRTKGSNRPPRDNYYLPDATLLAIVRECYAEDADFGALIDVLVGTGVRESQALKLWPSDLLHHDSETPRLMMWRSAKGGGVRDPEQRTLPITPRLARMLHARAIARGANRPLFDKIWKLLARFRIVFERLGLDTTITPYVARHCSIIRMLATAPLHHVAPDTSAKEIAKTYARYLPTAVIDSTTRRGLLDDALPLPLDNVVPLVR